MAQNVALQLHISLQYINPLIWRRVIVPENITLATLHEVIQEVMGWENCHLHLFEYEGELYTSTMVIGGDPNFFAINYRGMKLNRFLKKPKNKLIYEYDFGDGWIHLIQLEQIIPDFTAFNILPFCTDGAVGCPLEDMGGPMGYMEVMEALKKPNSKTFKELAEYYDIEALQAPFDLGIANDRLAFLRKGKT